MCGRYFLDTLPELLAGQFRVHKYPVYSASYNIAPTQAALAVRRQGDDNEWALLRWGLVPHWAKDLSIGARTLNARGESVAEKPAFRGAFRYRRCIVPASGFYEWQATPGGKQPFAIVPTDLPCFGFAGLWEHWTSPDGSVIESVAVVTTAANALMAPIHDRMPVILAPEDYERWMSASAADAQTLIQPCADRRMRAYPVSRAVGNVRNNSAALIAEIAPPSP
ncbi:MAG: SOS response-associated peptidase [Rhodanobacteraceae bacterium]|nr:SOS response-associated peptidase [Rhodanobacteraceae bacterium]